MSEQPTVQVNNSNNADHDLLIKLDTKFDIFSAKLDDLSVNTTGRIDALEKLAVSANDLHKNMLQALQDEKRDREESDAELDKKVEKNASRIDFLFKWFWIATGVSFAINVWFILKHGTSLF